MLRKNIFASILSLAILAASVAGQNQPQADGRDADRAAIRAHIESIFQAFIEKDGNKLRATHSEDWRGFLEGSRTFIRGIDEYMKSVDGGLKNREGGMTAYKITDFDVLFHGDIAIVSFVADIEGRAGARTTASKLRILDIYGKRNNGWIQVGSHTAVHPEVISRQVSAPATVSPQMRKAILDGREAVWRAWFNNDRAKLEKLIPEDAIAIDSGADEWVNRAAILQGAQQFADSGAKLLRLEFPRTEIQMYGNTIIVYTTYLYEVDSGGKRSTRSGRGTEIFVVRNGELVNTGWHLDAGQ